jgi:spermidine synthase
VSEPTRGGGGRARRAALPALFLLSGATALVYEVSWTRRLVLLVGSTSTATALLLAAYMLGLALGARLGGRAADRTRRPLRLYAALEAGAAALAFVLPWLLDAVGGTSFLTVEGREPLLLGAAFLLLLLPTTLLGATLPALSKAAVDDPAAAGPRVGFLYAANTLGAVAGALLAGFALVEALGVDGSARAAVAVNLLVAVAAWLLSAGEAPAAAAPGEPAVEEGPAPAPGRASVCAAAAEGPAPAVVRTAVAAAFAGGFVGLAAEVSWTRLLVFTMQGFTAAFSAMLGAFLLGSALGGAFFARAAGGARRPLAMLGWIQVGAGVAAAGTLAALYRHHDLVLWLRGAVAVFASARANSDASLLAAALAVLGPPAFLMGGVFTVAVRAAAGGLGDLGDRVGRIYAANTVGAVLGSLAAGFLGVPAIGARGTAAAVACVSVLAGFATLAASARCEGPAARPAARRACGLAAAAAGAVLLFFGRPAEPMILRSEVFLGPRGRENRLLESREGRAGVASVVENTRNGFTSLYTDEFLAASTEGRYRYMRMLGHIPMVLAEDPRRVLVMAFGTGTTAGALSTHPSVERLDIVEISPEVLDVARRFESVNRGVVERAGKPGRPDVRLHVEDARRFVLGSRESWDVITLEPLLPYTPGAVHLYTTEFYGLCRARLAPGGAMCQWFPIHAMSSDDFRSLAAAFVEVFPESSLWFVEETAALVGTTGPGPQPLPVARSAARLSAPGPKSDLEAGHLDDLAQWWSFRVCGGKALREWTRGATAMVDEHPDIEFHPVPARALTTYLHDNLVVALDLREQESLADEVDLSGIGQVDPAAFRERLRAASEATAAYMDGRASEDLYGFHASHTRLARDPREIAVHQRAAVEALATTVRRYADAIRANPRDRIVADRWRGVETTRLLNEARGLLAQGRPAEAADAYREAAGVGAPWNRDEAWTGLGRALLREGKPVAAREALEKSLSLYPGSRDAQAFLGEALVALGRAGEARPWFERAYEGGSGPSDEDTATAAARALASGAAGADGGDGGVPPDRDREIRAALLEALDDAGGARGPRRVRAVARLRGAAGREAEVLRSLLDPSVKAAEDPAQPPAERVRALSLLAAAGDPRIGEAALAVAGDPRADAALAEVAVDAAAEGGGTEALAPLLDPAKVAAPAVRARAADRLPARHERKAVEAVLGALEDPDPGVRTSALAALFQLTGRKDFDPKAPEPERREAVARLRDWWSSARSSWR